jgi:hypothetical protein
MAVNSCNGSHFHQEAVDRFGANLTASHKVVFIGVRTPSSQLNAVAKMQT